MNALEMKIDEYIPQINPTIIASEKSLMLPVVNTNRETTANKVVIVVNYAPDVLLQLWILGIHVDPLGTQCPG